MIKRKSLPTILGVVILLAATLAGVFFVNYKQIFRIGATGEGEPKDVRISNTSTSSFTISWTTDTQTSGFVVWDKGSTQPDESGYTHLVNLTGLDVGKNYTFKINSNGKSFDNNGVSWQAATLSNQPAGKDTQLISGTVLTATGQAVKKALVYVSVGGQLYSSQTSSSGNYVFQLPVDDPNTTLLEIFVQAGPQGVSSAQIFAKSAKPVPIMILGNTHDFRNTSTTDSGSVPDAQLNLPEDENQDSKFNSLSTGTPSSSGSVTLESVKEGELVTTTQPEFFGEGPAGTDITIVVESENPITDNVSVTSSGAWNWTPPDDLAPGNHKITITWKDLSGITRSLTRTFVVQAGEAPAFEASGSAQTASPSPTPTATSTSKASATPTASASTSPIPETGSLTPTLILSIMGLAVMAFSVFLWKHAQSI